MKKKSLNPFARKYNVFLPDTIELDTLLLSNPLEVSSFKNNPHRQLDRAKYVLGQIYSARYNETHEWQPSNEYTNLCFKNMRSVVRDFKKYADHFVKIGVIERDYKYYWNHDKHRWDKSKCMGYRFTAKYFPEGTKWVRHTIYDEKIVAKRGNKATIFVGDNSKYNPLIDHFYGLSVDLEAATNTLLELYPNDPDTIEQQLELLRRINVPELWSFKIGETGRLYNPISNIKSELRKHLKHNGKPLFEIDVKNSIPYQSLVLFDNGRLRNHKEINKALRESNKYIKGERVGKRLARIRERIYRGWRGESYLFMGIHLNTTKIDHYTIPYNIQLFMDMVLDGTIYEYLADLWNGSEEITTVYDRPLAKKKFLSILNQPPLFGSKERQVFGEHFPDVLITVDRINTGYVRTKQGTGKAKKRDYDLDCPFAYFTQKLEAHLILDLVALAFADNPDSTPIITLHDAIYTTKDNIVKVKQKLEQEARKLTGNRVMVEVKNLETGKKLNEFDFEYLQLLNYEKNRDRRSRSKRRLLASYP